MKTIMLGVGDMGATNTTGDVLRTLALGSCVAVIMLDPRNRSVGMAHVALPECINDAQRSQNKPGYYADIAVPELVKIMKRYGFNGSGKNMIVKLVGGSSIMDQNNTFNIGKRNILAIKRMLWDHGMGPIAEDLGGMLSRNVEVDVDRGKVVITSAGRSPWEI